MTQQHRLRKTFCQQCRLLQLCSQAHTTNSLLITGKHRTQGQKCYAEYVISAEWTESENWNHRGFYEKEEKKKKETQLWERLFHLYRCKLGWPRPHSSVAKQRRQTTIFPTPKQDFTAQEMNQRKQTSFTEVTPQISTVLKSRAAMI